MPMTPSGYLAPDIATLRSEFRTQFQTQAGFTPDWDVDDALTVLSEVALSLIVDNLEAVQNIYDAFNPNNATGRPLENLAAMALVERQPATKSRVSVTMTGTAATVVSAGVVIKSSVTGSRWALTANVTLPGTGVFEAEDDGPVPADASTLTQIVTPVAGWSAVTNPAQAELGREEERDDELRTRRLSALGGASTGTISSIQTAIDRLDWSVGVRVIDNQTGAPLVIGAFTLSPNSILVLLLPNVLTAPEEEELGQAMLATVAAGVGTNGTEIVSVTDDNDIEFTFRYDFATAVTVNVAYTVDLFPGYALVDIEDAAEDAILAYFAALRVGGDVRLLPLLSAFDEIEGVRGVTITLNAVAANFAIADTEIAEIGTIIGAV